MIKTIICDELARDMLPDRASQDGRVAESVAEIIADVRENRDAALYRLSKKFDGFTPETIEVPRAEIEDAAREVGADYMALLEKAAANIRAYHSRQVREGFIMTEKPGVVLGQRIIPLARAGIYAPGGTAAYPSTVLMDAIPASLAGVGEIIMCTPPSRGGTVAPAILAAALVAGVDRVFRVGGAQAVAAMAYGTESVPEVDKIVGPGNVYVQEAKRQVFGRVSIEMIAGPSEIMIISDDSSDPEWLAADMLSQAEHDANSASILAVTSALLAEKVSESIENQLKKLPREAIARRSIEQNARIFVVSALKKAINISNEIAPEHLEVCVDDPFTLLPLIKNAGSVFLGRNCPEALGDYFAGTNHVLPTGRAARFASPLGVDDFVKRSAFTYYSPEALANDGANVVKFAMSEGLQAHARSITVRTKK